MTKFYYCLVRWNANAKRVEEKKTLVVETLKMDLTAWRKRFAPFDCDILACGTADDL